MGDKNPKKAKKPKKTQEKPNTESVVSPEPQLVKKQKKQLALFKRELSSVTVLPGNGQSIYVCDDESHHWDDSLMLRVANYKNRIIQYAIDQKYDGSFFVDHDPTRIPWHPYE